MRIHAWLSSLAACVMATVASAQTATFVWHWSGGTGPGGALQPGDNARIWLDVIYTPPVGTLVEPNLTVLGLATGFFDIVPINDGAGTWVSSGPGFNGTPDIGGPFTNVNHADWGRRADINPANPGQHYGWSLGQWGTYVHQPQSGFPAGSIRAVSFGQLPVPGEAPNPAQSPVREIWRGQFTPDSFEPRLLTFQGRMAIHGSVSLYVHNSSSGQTEAYMIPIQHTNWGSLDIPVIPGPSGLALLGLGVMLATRRRR